MGIDLDALRIRLATAGYPGTGPDAAIVYAALFAFAAGRAVDAVLLAIGTAAARMFPAYGLTTPARLAEFVAQTAHETGGYRRFEENLAYSAARLAAVWPLRFAIDPNAAAKRPNAAARAIAGRPQAIAEAVYMRAAEGNVQPGDGWRYRGRGMIQLTFRNNYAAAAKRLGLPLLEQPALAADPATSLRIALDFWARAAVNACCDRGDYYGARGLTNCGSATPKTPPIGLADVAARRERLLAVLG